MIFNRTLLPAWFALVILLLAVCGYWMSSEPSDLGTTSPAEAVVAPPEVAAPSPHVSPIVEAREPTPEAAPAPLPPPRTIRTSELVAEYLQIEEVTERGDLARSIASMDDAESLREITALFRKARHPAEREALIAALGDTDFTKELDGKLALLTTALSGHPRNVRDAALGVVAQIEDPRAVALIKKVAQSDPDHEVREAAKALISQP